MLQDNFAEDVEVFVVDAVVESIVAVVENTVVALEVASEVASEVIETAMKAITVVDIAVVVVVVLAEGALLAVYVDFMFSHFLYFFNQHSLSSSAQMNALIAVKADILQENVQRVRHEKKGSLDF